MTEKQRGGGSRGCTWCRARAMVCQAGLCLQQIWCVVRRHCTPPAVASPCTTARRRSVIAKDLVQSLEPRAEHMTVDASHGQRLHEALKTFGCRPPSERCYLSGDLRCSACERRRRTGRHDGRPRHVSLGGKGSHSATREHHRQGSAVDTVSRTCPPIAFSSCSWAQRLCSFVSSSPSCSAAFSDLSCSISASHFAVPSGLAPRWMLP